MTGGRPPVTPWLDHLRRDRRGLPVPYVNRWGAAESDRAYVAYDRWVGSRAAFLDDSGQETPDFTAQDMGRQRHCMAAGLCQVCGRPVPWSRRNLVITVSSVTWVPLGGRQVPVVSEPWLDDRCVEIATRWCPALIRRRHDETLTVLPVQSEREVQLVVSTGWVEGHLEAETRAAPVAIWVKVALLRHHIKRGVDVEVREKGRGHDGDALSV